MFEIFTISMTRVYILSSEVYCWARDSRRDCDR